MKYCGIDLHSNNSVVLVSDEEDRIVLQKRLPNELGQIQAALEPHREELMGVVVESTFNWYWLVDGLMDAGYRVHLAHPSAIKKYEGLKYSGDFAECGLSGAAAAAATDGGPGSRRPSRGAHWPGAAGGSPG